MSGIARSDPEHSCTFSVLDFYERRLQERGKFRVALEQPEHRPSDNKPGGAVSRLASYLGNGLGILPRRSPVRSVSFEKRNGLNIVQFLTKLFFIGDHH